MNNVSIRNAVVGATSLVLLTACTVEEGGGDASEASERKEVEEVTIGFAQQTLSAPFYVAMNHEMERLSEERGFDLVTASADRDVTTQISQIEDLSARGVDALIVNPVEPDSQAQAVRGVSSDTHVVFIDTPIPDVGQVTAVVADNVTIGTEAGRMTAERFDDEPIEVGVINGGPRDSIVGPGRHEGFFEGLDESNVEYEIVAEANGEYEQDVAVQAAEDLLTANPDLDLIFGYNDGMALGALEALRTMGNTTTLVAGIDGQKEALEAINSDGCEGQYVATGLNSPSLAAKEAVEAAIAVATGEQAPAELDDETYTEAVGIDCENVEDYYDPESTF